ncbi:site-specific integrase [Ochrobactrum sp. S46]|nr:site-specific integrase [Ochrobactrum sp. S45]MBK0042436.1 site-specific integrase [Ochrobactrum sp. S46]
MGTIIERPRANGSVAYLAQILLKSDGKVVHRESRTFDRKAAANAWIKKREAELKADTAQLGRARRPSSKLSDAIDKYVESSLKEIGRTKGQVLNSIKEFPIADKECSTITSQDIVKFAELLNDGREPQTVGNWISHLASVFAIARPAWNLPLDQQAMIDAQVVMKRLGLITKSKQRNRRPTLEELDKILTYFTDRQTRVRQHMPMTKVILFALFSTRRQEEICRIEWNDYEREHKRVIVRDMKNPGEKIGNDVWCDLTDEAIAIIETMPRKKARIFPYTSNTISTSFTRACKILEIEDLHFHDLRHEGVSRLFEMGWNIPRVATVSGHRSWTSLKRYTHIRQTGDRYAGFNWGKFLIEIKDY